MNTKPRNNTRESIPTGATFAGIWIVIFAILAAWGGLPPQDEIPAFIIGGITLIAVVFISGVAFWHLLLRPLPDELNVPSKPVATGKFRQWAAIFLGISAISLTIGSLWDEIWHREYGLPFGEDLLWRPHILMYTGFTITIFLALYGLYLLFFRAKRTLQQRFRSDPIIAIITFTGIFLIYSLPIDPLWHIIYGEDITAWSIPHIVLTFTFATITLLMAAVQISITPAEQWRSVLKATPRDAVLMIVLSFAMTPLLLLFTSEWDLLASDAAFRLANPQDLIYLRPEWMLPVLLCFASTLVGITSVHALRRYGAATTILVVAFLVRAGMIVISGSTAVSSNMWLVGIVPAIGIDIFYGITIRRTGEPPSWISASIAAALTMSTLGFLAINHQLYYPTIELNNLPVMVIGVIAAALLATWLGRTIGEYLATANKLQITEPERPALRRTQFSSILVFAAVLIAIAVFIVTAAPPTNIY